MFYIEDNVIHLTRGDVMFFPVSCKDRETGEQYIFQPGDVLRFSVSGKKNVETVYLEKDFAVTTPSEEVIMFFDESETKIGEPINKATDYWYEVVLNPEVKPQTIIGFKEEGAAILKLYPEHVSAVKEPEELPENERVLDDELSVLSDRAVKNKVIAKAMLTIYKEMALINARFANYGTLTEGSTTADAELIDMRVDIDGNTHESAGEAVRKSVLAMREEVTRVMEEYTSSDEIKAEIANLALDIIDSALVEFIGNGVSE